MAQGINVALLEVKEEAARITTCNVCYFEGEDSVELDVHKLSTRHIYNIGLQAFKDKESGKVKDRHGISVDITCDSHEVKWNSAKGIAKSTLQYDSNILELKYNFILKNNSEKPVFLKKAELLHPLKNFCLKYKSELNSKPIVKGGSRDVEVLFNSPGIGYYKVPLSLIFKRGKQQICIIKYMDIDVTRDEFCEEEEEKESPFKGEGWTDMIGVIPGSQADGRMIEKLTRYKIPSMYISIFKYKLQVWKSITDDQVALLHRMLLTFPLTVGYGREFMEVHNEFFHTMLWLDEFAANAALYHYNMVNVPMHLAKANRVSLTVPGLAEKRPSLLKRDIVRVRVRYNATSWETQAYEGQIVEVMDCVVWIAGFHHQLLDRIEKAGELNFDVRFLLNRYPLVVQHAAIDFVMNEDMLDLIFPEEKPEMKPLIGEHQYSLFNREILGNKEQRLAVDHIIKGTSRPAPYIVFGPPGTGKTVTLVEAILQIKCLFSSSYTLVCAPSNSACDNIAILLKDRCSQYDLLRLHSVSRDVEAIPKELHMYSNISGTQVFSMQTRDINEFRIVVCTLISAAKFASSALSKHFTHVFVDEAGQAVEPEALVPIGGVLGVVQQGQPGGQLVLAGDPQQLGPICSSQLAEKAGLGMSLLERLMHHCPLYQRDKDDNYKKRYITKLLDNFRSHPTLLELPNVLFYEGELRANCGPEIFNDPMCTVPLLNNSKPGSTCVFHGVIGQERREGRSPSFFNQLEIDTVMLYVSTLLSPKFKVNVAQSDIGIIAPYIRQVYKLKDCLKKKNWAGVEVGTTETFQGREKRIILISTVRGNRNLLDYDKKHKLGFLVDKKRFNVATTRARSRLIVIGCPYLLEMDKHWKELIQYTQRLGSYEGCLVPLCTDEWAKEVTKRVKAPLEVEE